MTTQDIAALFGEDHPTPHEFAMHGLTSGRVWCALSVGGPRVLQRKADDPAPNEDALCVAEGDGWVLLAVADAHHGVEASHAWIDAIAERVEAHRGGPPSTEDLWSIVATPTEPTASRGDGPATSVATLRSESTLMALVLDRRRGEVRGVSLGDSSAVVVGLDRGAQVLSRPAPLYAAPDDAGALARPRFQAFSSPVSPGELVLVYTDGVNECEYGNPAHSIGPAHLESVWIRSAGDTERFVEGLVRLALAGVDGHAGGEDNIAIAAARV